MKTWKWAYLKEQMGRKAQEDGQRLCEDFNTYLTRVAGEGGKTADLSVHRILMCVFDGHAGADCMEFLKKEFHLILARELNENESDVEGCLRSTFKKAEDQWIEKATRGGTPNKSGATCTAVLIQNNKLWCAHVGDSPVYIIMDPKKSKDPDRLTRDHHPDDPEERKRIESLGGSVVADEVLIHKALCMGCIPERKIFKTARVLPGKIAVSRSIGDVKTKLEKYGGIPGCVSSEPEVTTRDMTDDMRAIAIFSDGVLQGVVDQPTKSRDKIEEETQEFMRALQKNLLEQYKDGYKDIKAFGNIAGQREPKEGETKMQYLVSRSVRDFLETGVARGGVEHKNQDNTTVVLGINVNSFKGLPPFED